MRQLLLAVLVLFCCSSVNSQAPTCTSSRFSYCSHTLATTTGMNDTVAPLLFKDYRYMYNQFLYLFGQNPGNTDGMLQVCNGLEAFNGCMFQNRGCFAIQNLMANTDIQNAYFIDGTLAMYQFNCGPGINTLVHEGLACAQRIMLNYQNTLQTCVSTYQSSITHDVANSCGYVTKLINCWAAPFSTASCRRNNAADVWWACEANRAFSLTQFPNCGITCDIKYSSSQNFMSHFDEHHKIVDGEHWFKIPNYMDKIDGRVQMVEGAWMNN